MATFLHQNMTATLAWIHFRARELGIKCPNIGIELIGEQQPLNICAALATIAQLLHTGLAIGRTVCWSICACLVLLIEPQVRMLEHRSRVCMIAVAMTLHPSFSVL